MKMIIQNERTIHDIQEEFHAMFPYLKLEFFSKLHDPGKPSHLKFMLSPEQTLGESRSVHNEGEIIITPQLTVSELEQQFGDLFGLGVQVFRKTGSTWIETIMTDNETLQEQNEDGENLTKTRQERINGMDPTL
jgi:hypothetical protein